MSEQEWVALFGGGLLIEWAAALYAIAVALRIPAYTYPPRPIVLGCLISVLGLALSVFGMVGLLVDWMPS